MGEILATDRNAMSGLAQPRQVEVNRHIARIVQPVTAQHGTAFVARRLGTAAFGREGDPFLNLDHFHMGAPTFPPHPHAGFSAVTYVLPESPAGMHNRDSRGDSSVILPGGLHWTAAGAGLVHEEVPERPDVTVEGFQIFVRQPIAQERAAPVIHHVEPDDVPVVRLGQGSARILAGGYDGHHAPFHPPSPLALIDIDLPADQPFAWSPEANMQGCAIYLFAGTLLINERKIVAPALILFERGSVPVGCIAVERARLTLLAGEPIDAPSVSNGPFVLSSRAALDEAVHRYRIGAMGTIR